jgi:hypothetical protein
LPRTMMLPLVKSTSSRISGLIISRRIFRDA